MKQMLMEMVREAKAKKDYRKVRQTLVQSVIQCLFDSAKISVLLAYHRSY